MAPAAKERAARAVRARVSGTVQGVGFRDSAVEKAESLSVRGWVRNEGDDLLVHAEGRDEAVAAMLGFLEQGPPGASVEAVAVEELNPEGHEQFAIRGVAAGGFVVRALEGSRGRRYELRLEVGGEMRVWELPKGPSLDQSVKRMAFEAGARPVSENELEGEQDGAEVLVWDRGGYEQGGRVPWPEAIDRGHAVFVLHGEKLEGGFALQRIRRGEQPQWLLIKRKDEWARPGSDVTAEQPDSVLG